jgi:hypothetical protein
VGQGFFFFMVFNGTIVFGKGPVRWLGAVVCAGLALLWWKTRRCQIEKRDVTPHC